MLTYISVCDGWYSRTKKGFRIIIARESVATEVKIHLKISEAVLDFCLRDNGNDECEPPRSLSGESGSLREAKETSMESPFFRGKKAYFAMPI